MGAKYTEKDLERANAAVLSGGTAHAKLVAQLIADVREECAKKCDDEAGRADMVDDCEALVWREAAKRIRSIK